MQNTQDADFFFGEIQKILNWMDSEQTDKALRRTNELLVQKPEDLVLQSCCAGILIDCGSVLKDIHSIDHGITIIKNLLSKTNSDDLLCHTILRYNLSNGYAESALLYQENGSKEDIFKALKEQKKLLQIVLLSKKELTEELLVNAICNYANLLDKLGRSIEAIDYYYECLAIEPNHATALGNCGNALPQLLNISKAHNTKILYESWYLRKESIRHKSDFVKRSGLQSFQCQLNALKNFENYLESVFPNGCFGLQEWKSNFENSHSWHPSPKLKKWNEDRLLLTVNPNLSNCPSEYRDDIFFENIVVSLDKSKKQLFNSLAHAFNHMKEDYATARYLYYQSQSQDSSLIESSSITLYMDTLDYADFGLRSGFLKSSLRLAIDLLDKCAGFINLYLELGHPEDNVTLSNIWYSKCSHKKGIHPDIQSRLESNRYLSALRDLNSDLYNGQYPAPFRNLRNDATHKRLALSWYGDVESEESMYSLDKFQTVVKSLLRMSKAAIIYSVGIVVLEESQRKFKRENKLFVPNHPFRTGLGLSDEADKKS